MLKNPSVSTVFLIFLFLPAYIFIDTVFAGEQTSEYDLKAAFLYNFTQFVTWPNDVFIDPDSNFNICIFGTDPFAESLNNLVENEYVGKHPIKVVHINQEQQFKSCHMLFIAKDKIASIQNLDSQLGLMPILTIGDSLDFADKSGVIGFGLNEQRIKLRINLSAATARHLTISSKLLRLSEVIVKNE
jgi:hypothetical protein